MIGTFLGSLVRGFKLFPVIVGAIIQIEQLQLKTAGWTWPESLTTLCTVVRIISIKFWVNTEQWTVNSEQLYCLLSLVTNPALSSSCYKDLQNVSCYLTRHSLLRGIIDVLFIGKFYQARFFLLFFSSNANLDTLLSAEIHRKKELLKLTIFSLTPRNVLG